MKNAIDWIKNNPISVAAAAVALIGFIVFAYFYVMAAPAYRAEKTDVLKEPRQKQKSLTGVPVPLPNEDPNAEPDIYNVVVNQKVISDVKDIYSKIKTQYEFILDASNEKNSSQHLRSDTSNRSVLLAEGAIWPDSLTFDLGERAKADYLQHFEALFTFGKDEGWNMPSMVASRPPVAAEIDLVLKQTAFNFVNSIGLTSSGALSKEQAEQLYAEQRIVLMQMLTNRARQIHLYVDLPRKQDIYAPDESALEIQNNPTSDFEIAAPTTGAGEDPRKAYPKGYPFPLASWAFEGEQPTPDEVWEGQVQLWITRDIMQAIHNMNRVGQRIQTTDADGNASVEYASVINSPIKRLLQLQPITGYVGMHTAGGVTEPNVIDPAQKGVKLGFGGESIQPTSSSSSSANATTSIYPDPPSELAPLAPTKKATENFGISPTGRISNSVFDVRHTRLIIDIEWEALPEFMEELRKINFMTVVKTNFVDVDEYKILREGGYVYGSADVVRAELVIESLFFRNWTEKLMPKAVKKKLLIIQPDASSAGFDQEIY